MAGGAIVATLALAFAPATGHVAAAMKARLSPVSLDALGSIASFTPVTTDDRLARAYVQARATARSQGFRFTPTAGSLNGKRSITIVVRAPEIGSALDARSISPATSIGIGPVGYNLGSSRGLARFATETTAARAESEPVIASSTLTPPRNFSLENRTRLSASLSLESLGLTSAAPATLPGQRTNAVDVGGAYSVTRNLDVTAGIRYKDRVTRMSTLTDDTKDSRAVYVGTRFKF